MAKTALTLEIEQLLYTYDPDTTGGCKINKFRSRHIGYEVPVETGTTSGGLVDCVRVDEILVNGSKSRACNIGRHAKWYKKHHPKVLEFVKCLRNITSIDDLPEFCDQSECGGSTLLNQWDNDICVTCYEIKVSVEDFHSKHGHNFCGNANYYVMPNDLYKRVKCLIPDDIGVIAYVNTDKYVGLRRVKECEFKSLDDITQKWLILNVMKKKLNCFGYNKLKSAVDHLYSMIDKSCLTCDLGPSNEDCRHSSDCILSTQDPQSSFYWKCHEDIFRSCGIQLEIPTETEDDIFE